ncbi:hypothetical protein ACQ4PT_026644 [Festuca glaucescens]
MAASLSCSFFFDTELVGEPAMPAQDACARCAKQLARDSDVFMYRGDTPFCSEDCRHEQMRLDAVCERHDARRLQRYTSPSGTTESHRGQREARKVSIAS